MKCPICSKVLTCSCNPKAMQARQRRDAGKSLEELETENAKYRAALERIADEDASKGGDMVASAWCALGRDPSDLY